MRRKSSEIRRYVNGVLTEKNCSKCLEWKTPDSFNKSAANIDGYHQECKPCSKQTSAFYDNKNPIASFLKAKACCLGIRGAIGRNAFYESLRSKVETMVNKPCPLCGNIILMSIATVGGQSGGNKDSWSLDQIVPGGGYTSENIQLLHMGCNTRKSNHTFTSSVQLAKYFARQEGWEVVVRRKLRGKKEHAQIAGDWGNA